MHNNLNFCNSIQHTIDATSEIMADFEKAQKYQTDLEATIFTVQDTLSEMKKNSDKDAKFNRRLNIAILMISLLTLIATVAQLIIVLEL